MKIVELFDIVKKEAIGTSNNPLFCRTDQGDYFVKFMDIQAFINGTPWYRALINEYIGSEIAKLMNLPVPETAIVKCKKSFTVKIDNEVVTISQSVNFGSKAIVEGPVLSLYTLEQLKDVENKNDFLSIMLFDAIMHNVDRDENNGNTLISMGEIPHLYIIDHGRLFGAGEIWDKYSLMNDQNNEIVVEPVSHNGVYSLLKEAVSLNDQIEIARKNLKLVTKEKLTHIIFSTPEEWGLSSEDANALIEYLWARFEKGEQYLSLIINGGKR